MKAFRFAAVFATACAALPAAAQGVHVGAFDIAGYAEQRAEGVEG
ncbi:hypothetical protein GGD83_001714 [Rhodoblastus sphagnicola]|nr:hypothetical protein [Rhodoblastus sphagnicola]